MSSRKPIGIYSGVASESQKALALAVGAKVYLTKPIGAEDLIEVLRSSITARPA